MAESNESSVSQEALLGSPSRKRRRSEEEGVDVDVDPNGNGRIAEGQNDGVSDVSLTRDSDFYFPDGTCVLRVENTLFNVRRTVFQRPIFFLFLFSPPFYHNDTTSNDDGLAAPHNARKGHVHV